MPTLLQLPPPPAKAIKKDWFSIPIGKQILLTNKSAVTWGTNHEPFFAGHHYVYAVLANEALPVAKLLSRADPEAKKRVIEAVKKSIGAVGDCSVEGDTVKGYKDASGKVVMMDEKRFAILEKWQNEAEKNGMDWVSAMDTGVLSAPGLSRTAIMPLFYIGQVKDSPERFKQQICFQ